jgi:hypothetical protein
VQRPERGARELEAAWDSLSMKVFLESKSDAPTGRLLKRAPSVP